jgi:hypothetical protein
MLSYDGDHDTYYPCIYAYTAYCTKAPLMTTTWCHLLIHRQTITSNHREQLHLDVSERPLFDYLTSKHQWSPNTVDDIDWDAFCMAARTCSSTEVHLLKLVHDKLLLCRNTSLHQKWIPGNCHYYSSHDTLDHLQKGLCNLHLSSSKRKYVRWLRSTYHNVTLDPLFHDK